MKRKAARNAINAWKTLGWRDVRGKIGSLGKSGGQFGDRCAVVGRSGTEMKKSKPQRLERASGPVSAGVPSWGGIDRRFWQ